MSNISSYCLISLLIFSLVLMCDATTLQRITNNIEHSTCKICEIDARRAPCVTLLFLQSIEIKYISFGQVGYHVSCGIDENSHSESDSHRISLEGILMTKTAGEIKSDYLISEIATEAVKTISMAGSDSDELFLLSKLNPRKE